MPHPLPSGKKIRSPGESFCYTILGPCCTLYDREQLPWPSCSLAWKGKQPSWNRVGVRFVADVACSRCPSYSVIALDTDGNCWEEVLTLYYVILTKEERHWWITRKPKAKDYPVIAVLV